MISYTSFHRWCHAQSLVMRGGSMATLRQLWNVARWGGLVTLPQAEQDLLKRARFSLWFAMGTQPDPEVARRRCVESV